jgi:hypothetical protein
MASSFVTDSNGHGSTLISDPALNEPVICGNAVMLAPGLRRLFFQKGTLRRLSNGRLLQLRGSSDQILYYIVKGHVLLHLWSLVTTRGNSTV